MTDTQNRHALALFRYGLIAEFTQLPAGSPGHSVSSVGHGRKELQMRAC
jgi:hypothetical protein